MKKIVCLISAGIVLASSVFAGFFNNRLLELRFDVPIGFSNNTFILEDIFQEDLVIDLREIADVMPENGLTFVSDIAPDVWLNANLLGVHVGVGVGVDIYGSFNLNKSIFDFFGYGYNVGDKLAVQPSLYTEVFATLGADVGLKFGKTKIDINPSLFAPLFAADAKNLGFNLVNKDDGSFSVSTDGCVNVYSQFGITDGNLDFTKFNTGDGGYISTNSNLVWNQLLSVAGVDLGGTVELPLIPGFRVIASARIPVVPGKFLTKNSYSAKSEISLTATDVQKMMGIGGSEEDDSEGFDIPFEMESAYTTDEVYNIHRPMKLNGYIKFAPLGNLITLTGGLGIGIRSPFSENSSFFSEYYVGGAVDILGGLLGASVSSEYTNEIFVHKASASISLRVTELDIGVSLQGPDLASSFSGAGFGLYIGGAIGF